MMERSASVFLVRSGLLMYHEAGGLGAQDRLPDPVGAGDHVRAAGAGTAVLLDLVGEDEALAVA